MEITHLGHSCLLVTMAGARILIDPGNYSDDVADQRGLDAIIVTHQHADHLDPARLPALVAANPRARLLCDPDSLPILANLGLPARVHPGAGSQLGSVRIDPVGALHALIHDEIPRVSNVGVRLSSPGEPTLFHPGDSLDGEPGDVDILAFPLNAPWQRSRDLTAFVRRIAAPVAFPIHDRLLSPIGRDLYLGQVARLGSPTTQLRDLAGCGASIVA